MEVARCVASNTGEEVRGLSLVIDNFEKKIYLFSVKC